jgi:hypothetical protein
MAAEKKTERRGVAWASFCAQARIGSQSSAQTAIASSSATKLYKADIDGIPHLIIEDPSIPQPASIPWSNIASVGWLTPVTS